MESKINLPVCLKAEHITKIYPGTKALDDVSFTVYTGKVNVLIGENGAGKSTLMKILAGIEKPSAGKMFLFKESGSEGMESYEELVLKDTLEARKQGIGIINQELSLFPNLNVYQNIFMSREKLTKRHTLDNKEHVLETVEILKKLKHPIPPETIVGNLRVGQQQIIEIAKNLIQENLRILIMDEPTSSLSQQEVDVLFKLIHELTDRGISIIYISHRLEEIMTIGDYISILRDGKFVAEAAVKDINISWLVQNMVGKNTFYSRRKLELDWSKQEDILEVRNLCLPKPGGFLLKDVSFTLKKGEILGVYGLMGSGRTELFECIMGLQSEHTGDILLEGKKLDVRSISSQIQNGFAIVPEDRQKEGLVQTLDIQKNMSLSSLKNFLHGLFINTKKEDEATEKVIDDISVKVSDKHLPIFSLSGGNQQKVVVGKCLLTNPKIMLLDEPCRGIDVGAKAEVFEIVNKYADLGLSIIVISSELKEITAVSDRIIVLSNGQKTAEFKKNEITEDHLVLASYKGHSL
jgi:erythritol transport system ATP-binding protein